MIADGPPQRPPLSRRASALVGLRREFLAAYISVSSSPESHGTITVLRLPTDSQALGSLSEALQESVGAAATVPPAAPGQAVALPAHREHDLRISGIGLARVDRRRAARQPAAGAEQG